MRKKQIMLPFLILAFLLCSTSIFALGIGIYGNAGGGADYWGERESEVLCAGGGFILDTNLAMNKDFNYRLNLGARYYRQRHKNIFIETTRIEMVHNLGFALVKEQFVRLWIGPQIPIGYIAGENTTRGFFIGIGLVVGLNVNIGNLFTVSLTTSIRPAGGYMFFRSKEINYKNLAAAMAGNGVFAFRILESTPNYEGGIGLTGQVNLSFMFRFNDSFSGGNGDSDSEYNREYGDE